MNYKIEKNSGESAYMQLYRYIRRDIVSGVYPYGSRIPSKRTISQDTGLSLITVEHALDLLCEEGYVEARLRSGYYVCFRDRDFTVSPSEYNSGIIKYKTETSTMHKHEVHNKQTEDVSVAAMEHQLLKSEVMEEHSGENDEYITDNETSMSHMGEAFPFSVLTRTMRRVLADYGERLMIKSPNQGCEELRLEISAYLMRSRGIKVHSSQIVIGAGAEYLYGLIAQLLGRDRIYALENPSYDQIRKVYHSMDIKCDMLDMGPEGIRSSELERTEASVLHVTPFNSYPSGITAGISKKHEYLQWAKARQGYIIEDNYDSELTASTKPEDPLFNMAGGTNVIYVNTFSRTIAPSIRVGYMILPEDMVDKFIREQGFYSCTVSLFEQYVLADLLGSGDFERHINRVRRIRRKEVLK